MKIYQNTKQRHEYKTEYDAERDVLRVFVLDQMLDDWRIVASFVGKGGEEKALAEFKIKMGIDKVREVGE